MPESGPVTALIVDDDIDIRALVRVVLEASELGIHVVAEAVDGEEAVAVFERLVPPPVPAIVILDNRMPYLSGIEAAEEMRRIVPLQHIVLFTAYLTPALAARAKKAGIDACLSKSDVEELPALVISPTRPGSPA
ncbi:MAG TPA: response regulator transcription factor [Acidimicrobiia bacterium]|nr:response regulator transcription factor [Acidimicrobiia bacterium]